MAVSEPHKTKYQDKNLRQVQENVGALQFGPLSDEQMREIDRVLGTIQDLEEPDYIPYIFELYNQAVAFNEYKSTQWRYDWIKNKEEPRADSCIQCGQCVELCPQQLDIPEWLAKAHELLKQPESS